MIIISKIKFSKHLIMLLSFTILFFSTQLNSDSGIINFKLPLLDEKGNWIYFEEFKAYGKNDKLLLNFAWSGCQPCRKEIPELLQRLDKNSLIKSVYPAGLKNGPGSINLLIVFVGDSQEDAVAFFKEIQAPTSNLRIGYDTFEVTKDKFGVQGFPTSVVIDSNKSIVYKTKGNSREDFESLIKFLFKD